MPELIIILLVCLILCLAIILLQQLDIAQLQSNIRELHTKIEYFKGYDDDDEEDF